MRKCLFVIAAMLLSTGPASARLPSPTPPRFPRLDRECARADFSVADRPVRAAVCRRGGGARQPALVVLHGCGGFNGLDERLAERFAERGYTTLYIDYFALTRPPGRRGFCNAADVTPSVAAAWQEIIVSAAAALRRRPDVDARRVGVVGWSMGADLALVAAARTGVFGSVVAYSPSGFTPLLGRNVDLPPTLVLMSTRGDVHSIRAARALLRRLRAARTPSALFVYQGGSHYWQGRQGEQGLEHALAFLHRHLGLPASATPS